MKGKSDANSQEKHNAHEKESCLRMQWCEQRKTPLNYTKKCRDGRLHTTKLDQVNVKDIDLTLLLHQRMASPYKCKKNTLMIKVLTERLAVFLVRISPLSNSKTSLSCKLSFPNVGHELVLQSVFEVRVSFDWMWTKMPQSKFDDISMTTIYIQGHFNNQ